VAGGAGLSGLGFMQALIDGKIPPPIALLLNMRPTKADHGLAVFECTPDESVYNPIGLVHGGLVRTLADSAAGCAVHTTLEPEPAIPRSTSPSTTSDQSPWPAAG
jgi:acyl-coenzyme A thioesterase PaaI-like protein